MPSLLSRCAAAAIVTACVTSNSAKADDVDWQYPAPVRAWEIEGGYRVPVENDSADDTYYRITYKGSLIDSSGTPLQASQHFEITTPKAEAPGGDRSALELLLEDGSAVGGGELLEMNGGTPLPLHGLEKLQLRGTAYVGSDLQSNALKAAVGLESPPLRVPGLGKTGASNWFVLGVMGERSEETDTTAGDSTYGVLTGRLFLGKAFGWHKKASVEDTARAIEDSILGKASDLAGGQKLATELGKIPAARRTALQQLIIDTVGDTTSDAEWRKTVHEMATGTADALTDQPMFAAYLEATGWNAFSPDEAIPRHRGLVTATVDYWPLLSRDDVILRARYEWGFQRSQPNIRVNQFLITITIRL